MFNRGTFTEGWYYGSFNQLFYGLDHEKTQKVREHQKTQQTRTTFISRQQNVKTQIRPGPYNLRLSSFDPEVLPQP
ncbi:unnamed protein product [Allacma fusca]|uniref:Uncharacterized protein n=1 Tax=Allacma fusca TaxID=39272 RepID=A0A8J2KHP4_9HEXA|nr:unnamed protein product [Allacma fusca]